MSTPNDDAKLLQECLSYLPKCSVCSSSATRETSEPSLMFCDAHGIFDHPQFGQSSTSSGDFRDLPQANVVRQYIEQNKHVLCNLCGLSASLSCTTASKRDRDLKINGSYYSTPGNGFGALDDMTTYTMSLCEFCVDWLFTKCVIPPKVYDGILGEVIPFRPAIQRVYEDGWRQEKQAFLDEKARRDAARESRKAADYAVRCYRQLDQREDIPK